VEFV